MFGIFKSFGKGRSDNQIKSLITAIHKQEPHIWGPNNLSKVDAYQDLKKLPDHDQKELILQLLTEYEIVLNQKRSLFRKSRNYDSNNYSYYSPSVISALIAAMLKRKLNYNESEWMALFEKMGSIKNSSKGDEVFVFRLSDFPINHAIKQIEYHLKNQEPSDKLIAYIEKLLKWDDLSLTNDKYYYGSDLRKAVKKLEHIIGGDDKLFLLKSDDIGPDLNEIITECHQKHASYNAVFTKLSNVSGGKPSAKFTKEISKHIDDIGLENYKKSIHSLLQIPLAFKPYVKTHQHKYGDRIHEYTEGVYLCDSSKDFVKGLVWTCSRFSDKETINLLVKVAQHTFTKIPGKGPAAASIGNACVYILGNMRGKDGLGALSRLKLKVRQNNVKKTIDKFLLEGAKKYNVSVEELKEMAVPNYGLVDGSKEIEFDDYKLSISIGGSKVMQQWIKPDGTFMKSVPAKVKNTAGLAKKLTATRKEIKEIQKVYSAQKQRIDNQYILDRTWPYASFEKYYLTHGLVYPITSKLIWSFEDGNQKADGILREGVWTTVDDQSIDWISSDTLVKLWHPVNAKEKNIVDWREKMMKLEWKQPLKQAYRELYILTDAEINTKSYSNRMAAHILKQHQFSTLANLRNWKYSLMGAYDDGRDNEICSKILPEYGITAEYWIDELTNDLEAFNEAGIWLYVATDQVKFKNAEGNPMDLIDVPKMVFSEIMRDVDLFVGVCSVGNDPQWMDNNGDRQDYRDYWQSYSFGDLTEIAKTRKSILENLLPRLNKIRDKAEIKGKFLFVEGKLRTYKIHIGSGNILMEPNDQYLCIVPSRASDKSTDKLFIPFEGDRGLSIVLSKAFLLAEDDKIEDASITSQINR